MKSKTSATSNSKKSLANQGRETWLTSGVELILFAIIHVLIFFWLFHTLYKTQYSATGLYFEYASNILNGQLPYRDFSLEYPPLALLFFILPRLIADNWQTFSTVYQAEVLIFDMIGLLLIYIIARRMGKAPWKLLTVYTLAVLAIGPIIAQQYDIFPAILTLISVYFFCTNRHKTSWAFLALGTLTKFYPAALVPVYLIYYLRNRQYSQMWSGLITFAAICLVIFLPFLIISPDSLWNLVSYHSQRGIQIESTYSAFLLMADKLGLTSVQVAMSYGSWNLISPIADTLSKLSTYILGLALLAAYWFVYRQVKPGKSQFTRIGLYTLLVIAIVLAASKVFSPQYLIWLIPAIPLIFNRWRNIIAVVFIFIGILTYIIFPVNYLSLLSLNTEIIAVLFLRDILIILLIVLAVASLRRMKPSD